MAQKTNELIRLSASRLITLKKCSWVYYSKYTLKLRDKTNDGAMRGTVTHAILECLLKDNRRDVVKELLEAKTTKNNKEITRFISLKRHQVGITHEKDNKGVDNYNLIDKMIIIGLKFDFFCEDEAKPSKLHGEREFDFTHDEKYRLMGYIDKIAEYNGSDVKIVDYKTSQNKFAKNELADNYQAMVYILYCKRVLKAKAAVDFMFLRSPRKPVQTIEYSDECLKGFEEFLEKISKYMVSFNRSKGLSNLAYHKGQMSYDEGFAGRAMCGKSSYKGELKPDGSPVYACSFKWPRKYYAGYKDGKLRETADERVDLEKKGYTVEEKSYPGCPIFNEN
tara:strand:- start:8164 stop:9171 length:1008 start_codon:yes stop_codon:yes gene_type:complete